MKAKHVTYMHVLLIDSVCVVLFSSYFYLVTMAINNLIAMGALNESVRTLLCYMCYSVTNILGVTDTTWYCYGLTISRAQD